MRDHHAAIAQQVRTEQARLVHRQLPGIMLIPPLVGCMLTAMHWDLALRLPLALWLGSNLLIFFAGGTWVRRRFPGVPVTDGAGGAWLREFLLLAAASGLIWGAAAWVFFTADDFSYRMITFAFLYGACATIALTLTAYPPAFFASATLILLLLFLRLLAEGATIYNWLAIATLLYFGSLTFFYYNTHSTLIRSIVLWFERNALMRELEQRRLQAEMQNRDRIRLLEMAGHDLRQPLRAHSLFLRQLSPLIEEPAARELLTKLEQSHAGLNELFDSLLAITQPHTARLSREVTHESLTPLLQRLHLRYRPLARERDLRLRMRVCNKKYLVRTPQTERVLGNLIENALKYTREGGVLIACRCSGQDLRVDVVDTGPGIPVADRDAIFDDHFRGERTEDIPGSGLGLAIVRELCAELGYRLYYKTVPGRGSRFSVFIPHDTRSHDKDTPTSTDRLPFRPSPTPTPHARPASDCAPRASEK